MGINAKSVTNIPNKSLPFIWYFVKKIKYSIFTDYAFWIFSNTLIYLFLGGYIFRLLTNKANDGTLDMDSALRLILSYSFIMVSYCFTVFVIERFTASWKSKVEYNINSEMFKSTIDHEMDYFSNNMSGSIGNKINNIVTGMNDFFRSIYFVVNNNLGFFGGVVIFYFIDYRLALFAFIWHITFHLTLFPFLKKQNKVEQEFSEEKSKSMGIINDSFINISNIKIFSSQRKEYRIIKKQSSKILRSLARSMKIRTYTDLITYFFTSLFMIVSISIVYLNYLSGKNDMGTLLFVLSICTTLCFWINWEIINIIFIVGQLGKIQDSLDTLIKPIKIKNMVGAKKIKITEGKIVFKSVNFYYNRGY